MNVAAEVVVDKEVSLLGIALAVSRLLGSREVYPALNPLEEVVGTKEAVL